MITGDLFPIKDLIDILSIGILITLCIYHLIIYFGRVSYAEEKYNLYFAIFALNFAFYIYIYSYWFIMINKIILHPPILLLVQPTIGFILVFGIFWGAIKFLSLLLNFPDNNFFNILYILLLIPILLTIPNFFIDMQYYYNIIFPIIFLIIFINAIIILGTFLIWIIKNNLFKRIEIKIIFIGFCILIIYCFLEHVLRAYSILKYMYGNFVICISIYIFAYSLAKKFNREHKELLELKISLENKVEDRTKELEMANQEKTNFFINLAHETKTPLTLINNYLEKYINEAGINEKLKIIKQNVDKLNLDIENFLDTEKLEKGQIFYNHDQVVNFSDLLTKKIILFKEIASNKTITISSHIQKNLYIKADPFALYRVINNIIMNAVKYTDKNGEIKIELKNEIKKVLFITKDTGIGISLEQQENIFKPFYQISREKMNIQGIGMGLYIVSQILKPLNAEIKLQSELTKGSTFTISFSEYNPLDNEVIQQIEIKKPVDIIPFRKEVGDTNYNANKQTVFIIEDNLDLNSYLKDELENNYNVFSALNGKEALQKLNNIPHPDLIISDIMMDEMDGYELLSNLLKDNRYDSIPFIFLSAKSTINERVKGLSHGAIDYVNKPFYMQELLNKVSSILSNKIKQKKNNLESVIKLLSQEVNKASADDVVTDKLKIFNENCIKFHITDRQKEIVFLINEGYEYKEIGKKLGISINTVINHVQNLYEKLKINSRIDLINKLFRSHLI